MPFQGPDTDEEVKPPQPSGFVGPDEPQAQQPVIPQAETQPEDDSSLPPLTSILAAGQRAKTQQDFSSRPTPVVTADESDAMARDINTPFTDPAQMKTPLGAFGAELISSPVSKLSTPLPGAEAVIHNTPTARLAQTFISALPDVKLKDSFKGGEEGLEETAAGTLSPVGIATLAFKVPAIAGKLMSLGFAIQSGSQLPASYRQIRDSLNAGDYEGATKGFVEFVANGTITGLAGAHAILPEGVAKLPKSEAKDYAEEFVKNNPPAQPPPLSATPPPIPTTQPIGEPNAEAIRSNTGQSDETGQVKKGSPTDSGSNVQLPPSGTPNAPRPEEVAQPNPPQAINPKIESAREALTENMQGRSMEISKADLNDPNNPHLKKVIADWNAKAAVTGQPPIPVGTTWFGLKQNGVVELKPTDKGFEIKVATPAPPEPVTPPATIPTAPIADPAARLSELLNISNPTPEQTAERAQLEKTSTANGSRKAFLKANGGVLPTPESPKVETPTPVPEVKPAIPETIPPKVETKAPKTGTEALATAGKVKIETPEGATFIRGTTADGKASVQPVSAFAKFNPFKDAGIAKIEAGTRDKSGKFTPMKGDVGVTEILPKDKSFGGLTDIAERPVGEGEAMGAEAIKEMVSNPKFGFNGRESDVASALLTRLEKAGMDLGKLRVAIRQNIEGGFAGMSQVAKNLIELSGRATAATFPHEMFHFLFENLPDNQRAAIGELRLEELRKVYGDNIPDKLRTGTMSSDEFLQSGLPHSQYPLINDSEFLASFAGEKFAKETFENRNAPSTAWTALRDKVQNWIRIVVRTAKEFLRVRPDLDSIYQDLLNGKWQPTPETGLEYEQTPAQRQGSLMTTPRQLAEVSKNLPQLEPEQQELIQRSAQEQNAWTRIPSINYLIRAIPEGVKSKLKNIFQGRIETASEAGPQKAGPPVNASTIDRILNDPSMTPDQRMLMIHDIVDNNVMAENQIARTSVGADIAIDKFRDIITEQAEEVRRSKDSWDVARNSIKSAISDYQNQQAEGRDAARNQGAVDAFNHAIAQVEGLKDGSEALERVFNEMERTVPAALLENPSTTAKEIVDEFRQGLSDAELGKQLGITPDMVTLSAEILSASKSLATDIEASKYSKTAGFTKSIEELTRDAAKPDKTDLRSFVAKLREPLVDNAALNKTIQRSNQKLARALRQFDDWNGVKDTLQKVSADPDWKAYRQAAYNAVNLRDLVVQKNGRVDERLENPLTGELVTLPTTSDAGLQRENVDKIKQLANDVRTYLANPTAPGYEPRRALGWKQWLDTVPGTWLNPDVNPAMPHISPWLEVPTWMAWLRHPGSTLRTFVSGLREGREVQTRLEALAAGKKQIESNEKATGLKSGNDVERAAMSHGMSINEWKRKVWTELAGKQQYLGQVAPKLGDPLFSGERVNAADMEALRSVNADVVQRFRTTQDGMGITAIAADPARTIKQVPRLPNEPEGKAVREYSRRALPTSPTGNTLTQDVSRDALRMLDEWRKLKTPQQQVEWLNDPDNFNALVGGHMQMTATPKYPVKTPFEYSYSKVVADKKSGADINTVQSVVDHVFDNQHFDIEEGKISKTQIQKHLLSEIGNVFDLIEKDESEKAAYRSNPSVSIYTADNAFTRARSEKPLLPFTLMDYGALTAVDRMKLNHDAMAWYVNNLLGPSGAFDRLQGALSKKLDDYDKRAETLWAQEKAKGKLNLFPTGGFPAATRAEVMLGNELYDYNQIKTTVERMAYLRSELQRVFVQSGRTSGTADVVLDNFMRQVGAQELATPSARSTHTLGNLMARGVFYKKMGLSLWGQSARVLKDMVVNLAKDIVINDQEVMASWEKIAKSPDYGSFMHNFSQTLVDRKEDLERLRQLGIVARGNIGDQMQAYGLEWKRVMRNTSPDETVLGKAAKLPLGAAKIGANALLQIFPKLNDAILMSAIPQDRIALVNRFKKNAVEYLGNRKALNAPNYTDLTDARNFLTPQELTGSNINSDTSARRLRNLFSEAGMSLDTLMMKYHLAYEDAKAAGRDTSNIPFLTPGEESTLDFKIAEETGLSTAATRNLAGQGSALRAFGSYLHGLPMWQLWNMLESINKVSNKGNAKHVLSLMPYVLSVGGLAMVTGLLRQQIQASSSKAFYNQSTTLPTVSSVFTMQNGVPQFREGQTAEDAAKLGVRAVASWFPVLGDIVNGIVLNTPDRMGGADSMINGWNVAEDIFKTASQMVHGGDIGKEALDFAGRHSPLTRIVSNRLESRSGINKMRNAANDIRAVLPPSMEQKSRQSTGAIYQPGPLTPFIQRMENAAYNGNDAEFQKAYDEAVQLKKEAGAKNPELAVRESWMTRNPWLANLKTLPTDQERDDVFNRMTPEQQAEVRMAEDVFGKYTQQIGGNPAFTFEQRQANQPGGFGRITGGAGQSATSLPRSGARPISNIRAGSIPRSTINRIRGRGRSYQLGGGRKGIKAPRLHVVRSRGRTSRNRIRRKRTTV